MNLKDLSDAWSNMYSTPRPKERNGVPVLGETSFTIGNIKVTSMQKQVTVTETKPPYVAFCEDTGKKNKPRTVKSKRLEKTYSITQGKNTIRLTDDEYGVFEDMIAKDNVICDAENDDTYPED